MTDFTGTDVLCKLHGRDLDRCEALAATPSGGPLREALEDLLDDTQHADHDCGDTNCPVARARAALAATPSGGPLDVDIEQLLTDIGKSDNPDEAERWARRAVAVVRSRYARLTEDAG